MYGFKSSIQIQRVKEKHMNATFWGPQLTLPPDVAEYLRGVSKGPVTFVGHFECRPKIDIEDADVAAGVGTGRPGNVRAGYGGVERDSAVDTRAFIIVDSAADGGLGFMLSAWAFVPAPLLDDLPASMPARRGQGRRDSPCPRHAGSRRW